MSKLMEILTGNLGGVDIGVIIAAIGYAVKVGVEVKDWYIQRKEERIDRIILDAINWVYVNRVQKQKKEGGSLTAEQANQANAEAVHKTMELANSLGVTVETEGLAGRVQSVFSTIKEAVRSGNK